LVVKLYKGELRTVLHDSVAKAYMRHGSVVTYSGLFWPLGWLGSLVIMSCRRQVPQYCTPCKPQF